MGQARASSSRFKRDIAPQPLVLTEDDVAILKLVHRHRFVRADDIYRLFPGRSRDKLSRRLVRLYRARYLDRPIAQVDHLRDPGSAALVYGLDTAGARHLKEHLNVSVGSTDWKARNRSYTRENLDHTLAVTRFLIDAEAATAAHPHVDFVHFEEILANAPAETRRTAVPGRWPVPVTWKGNHAEVHLAPDAIFGLRLRRPDAKPLHAYFFAEIDRGTMTVAPAERVQMSEAFLYRATVLRKFIAYAESWRRDLHKDRFAIQTVRVLTLTERPERAQLIRLVVDRLTSASGVPPEIFLFGTTSGVASLQAASFVDCREKTVQLLPSLLADVEQ